jgi:DHA1 family multidrug resistance protein-like MFS transporter
MSGLGARARHWLDRWRPLLPVLVAEFVILLGFGALLPVLPLYVTQHQVDVPTLGLITAAWAIAKLVSEPIFGYLADHSGRRKPFMVAGTILLAVFTMLPLIFTSATALFVLRLLSGAAAGMYDPAARGIIVDGTREGERGEAFGLYSAFQMGGFLIGPVVGALGAAVLGGTAFPFVLTGILTLVAGAYLAVFLPSQPIAVIGSEGVEHAGHSQPHDIAFSASLTPAVDETPSTQTQAPLRALWNGSLVSAVVMYFGFSLAFGVYEVIWTLYMTRLGASLEWVGVTFSLFGLGIVIFSPIAGRVVDRVGAMRFAATGGIVIIVCGVLYAIATEPVFPSIVVPFEAVAEAFLVPALFAIVAIGSPPGRSSTAQGLFGASSTIGLIVASLAAGALWARDPVLPFWFFVVGASICLAIGLTINWLTHRPTVAEPDRGSLAEA